MPFKTDQGAAIRYGQALCNIRDVLSGKEWDADALDAVANIMREAGFHLYEKEDGEPHWFSTSSGRIEFQLSLSEAQSGYHTGDCEADVLALSRLPHIAAELAEIDPDVLREELREYGAWEDSELQDHDTNLQRILWLACSDIVENANSREGD